MTTTLAVLIEPKQAEITQAIQYTVITSIAVIDKITVTNTGAATATISINIPTNLGSVAASNLIVNARSLDVGESYTCPEMVGHVLKTGDYISTIASVAGTLTIRASGREIV
tara:strand:- start:1201 stop:1536 length:336 start_codon:yes stop_codon:yes gene_type:complete